LVTYVEFISRLVRSQRQADAVYFDLSNTFDLVPHFLLPREFSASRLTDGYANCFSSYISNRKSQISLSGVVSSPYEFISGVPQGSVLEPLLFNMFINDLCNAVAHFFLTISKYTEPSNLLKTAICCSVA
jgi:hypothetical protein